MPRTLPSLKKDIRGRDEVRRVASVEGAQEEVFFAGGARLQGVEGGREKLKGRGFPAVQRAKRNAEMSWL